MFKTLRRLLTSVVLVLILAVALVLALALWALSGRVRVSALETHSPPVEWLLTTVRDRSVERAYQGQFRRELMGLDESPAADEPLAAIALYAQHCQMCHGGPGVGPEAVGLGLNPLPPALDREGRGSPPERDHWIIANGLRMTGMPAYEISLTDEQIWGLALLTSSLLPQMTAEEYAELSALEPEATTPEARIPEPRAPADGDR